MGVTRQTQSVKIVWESFSKTHNAISVVDLVEQHQNAMNKTTVYRILDRFEKEGKLHAFLGKNGLKWYAKCDDHCTGAHAHVHPHFQCNQCGKVQCLSISVDLPHVKDLKIEQAHLLLSGQCTECLN